MAIVGFFQILCQLTVPPGALDRESVVCFNHDTPPINLQESKKTSDPYTNESDNMQPSIYNKSLNMTKMKR